MLTAEEVQLHLMVLWSFSKTVRSVPLHFSGNFNVFTDAEEVCFLSVNNDSKHWRSKKYIYIYIHIHTHIHISMHMIYLHNTYLRDYRKVEFTYIFKVFEILLGPHGWELTLTGVLCKSVMGRQTITMWSPPQTYVESWGVREIVQSNVIALHVGKPFLDKEPCIWGPEHCQGLLLSTEPEIAPEHSRLWRGERKREECLMEVSWSVY